MHPCAPLTFCRSVLVVGVLAGTSSAQSIYTVHGPLGRVFQHAGPSAGACNYPFGPLASSFPFAVGSCSPAPFSPPPSLLGDIAVDRVNDHVYVTNGALVGVQTPAGIAVTSFPVSIPTMGGLTGMGFDGLGGLLWVTDGIQAAALQPPTTSCAAPSLVVPPFALPGVAVTGLYTDIDWDSASQSLLLCSANGFVASVLVGGAPGPHGLFPVAPGSCPLPLPLTGIAVDAAAAPGSGAFFVGSATMSAYLLPGDVPAPLTFYRTATCATVPIPFCSGLAFAARPISFGQGDGAGAPTPFITSTGQSLSPSPGFAIQLFTASSFDLALLFHGVDAACPAFELPPPVLLALAPTPSLIFAGVTSATGTATANLPLPSGMSPPQSHFFQWFVVSAEGEITSSAGLEASIALP